MSFKSTITQNVKIISCGQQTANKQTDRQTNRTNNMLPSFEGGILTKKKKKREKIEQSLNASGKDHD